MEDKIAIAQTERLDHAAKEAPTSLEGADAFADIDEKKVMRRIDLRLVPWLSLLYLLSFLDRTAIANAKLYGMTKEIGASDGQYRIALTIFFIPYALLEPVTNVLLNRLRPGILFTIILLSWGLCMAMQGIVQNPGGLYATRFCLGAAEAGLFPGVNHYLSRWYKRSEFGLRAAIFFSAASASGAFGGLLAAALAQINVGNYHSWRWIFIVEGIFTFAAGLVCYWMVYDYPADAKFLTPRERDFVVHRLRQDSTFNPVGEKFTWRKMKTALFSIKTLLGALVYMGADGALYAFSLFLPSIVQGLGYKNPNIANLITVPVYVWACILTVCVGFSADRTGYRSYYNLACFALGAAGYIILLASRSYGVSYFGVYLAASGIYPNIPSTIAWVANNAEGHYRRALILGVVIGWGNLNGVVSSNIYLAKQKPWYPIGHGIVLGYILIGFFSTLALIFYLKWENKNKASGKRDVAIGGDVPPSGITADGRRWYPSKEAAKGDLGDRWPGFNPLGTEAEIQRRIRVVAFRLFRVRPLYIIMSAGLVVSAQYGYVLAVALSHSLMTLWQGIMVGGARKAAKIPYPQAYAEVAEAKSNPLAHKFNCWQRVHSNTLEALPLDLTALAIAGIEYPQYSAAAGAVAILGRIVYSLGYGSGDPKKRVPGGALAYLGKLTNLFLSFKVIYHLVCRA